MIGGDIVKKHSIIYLLLAVTFAFLLTGCGIGKNDSTRQSAAAKLTYSEDQKALMTVDLTDGYSVEFVSGAAYFFQGDKLEDSNVIAHAFVISKNDYEEEINYFKDNKDLEGTFKNIDKGTYSYTTDDNVEYFFSSNDDLYLKVVVQKEYKKDADSIYTCFSAEAAE